MIPKVIHYCWFGGNPLPKYARKCVASWRKFFPDYEIREWNEDNFDVNMIPYTREAYKDGKYAFVSDFARFYTLYHYGGLYFDTDVEVVKSMDDIVARGAFMGIEQDIDQVVVAPGLGMGAYAGMDLYKRVIDHYVSLNFAEKSESQISGLVVECTTDCLRQLGFVCENRLQQVADVWIYPNDWFNPLDDATGRMTLTDNTRSIHHYSKTWIDNYGPLRIWITRRLHRIFKADILEWLKHYIKV